VKDSSGNVIWKANPKRTQAISAGVAYEVTRILQMNIQSGTGTKAKIDRPEAGKTGTASNWCDAWFCGYTPNLSTTVWMGNADAQVPMTNVHGVRVTGGSFPAEMWQKFMDKADRDYAEKDFVVPTVLVHYDPLFNSAHSVTPSSSSTVSLTSSTTTEPGQVTTSSDQLPPDITAPPTPTTNVPSTSF